MKSDSTTLINLHLVSDSTGGTLQGLAEAALAQFDDVGAHQRLWPQIRSVRQMEKVIREIELHSGPVLYTLVDHALILQLEEACDSLGVPCIAIMAPVLEGLARALKQTPKCRPGLQHKLDDLYFKRIAAIDFAMSFDDGQSFEGIEEADVILVGVSRTSKTPTCVYLARHGIRAANIPLVPHAPFPQHLLTLPRTLFVGLTGSPDRLIELRSTRLKIDYAQHAPMTNSYVDPEKVEQEVSESRRFFRAQGWPVIDVTRRSVEETAAEITVLYQEFIDRLEENPHD
ncbi:MAG: pyruvate, water dikinase regulatory protein [Pseudobdellovibrionaceae bacterium]